jgi:simple sugar transport system ATP-binding protein
MMAPILEVKGLSKAFGAVQANKDLNIHVERGEIIALLGENGAGKSTLVKQIFGLITPDEGHIIINGSDVAIKNPSDAISRGIGMVHQHFQLVPVMTVAENVILGNEPHKGPQLDLNSARAMVRDLASKLGMDVDPDTEINDLPVGTQQRVEILKALSRKVDLLILDEPTAVLTPQETDELLQVMKQLAAQGTSIVFITHKLREVLAVADRVYVLRNGRMAGEVRASETDQAALAHLMVGRDVVLRVQKGEAKVAHQVLEVKDLVVLDDRKLKAVNGLSLTVNAGEILGVAGVEGNGQREFVEAIAGMRQVVSGTIMMKQELDITKSDPYEVHAANVGHIPEDREKHGLVASYSIADNLVLNRFDEPEFAAKGIRNFSAINTNAEALVEKFDVRTSSIKSSAASLSGGNKQKVVVARELSAQPELLVASQPTRGVDVGSIEFIHNQIIAARDAGAGVLLVSAELDEILSLSDRIVVVHQGRVVAEMSGANADRGAIGRLMAGGQA